MKIFFSESQPDYSTYTFNYAIYCLMESTSELPAIYNQGFLPYTGNPNLGKEVFYLARSLRVDLDRFDDTSENRRVNRKVEPLDIQLKLIKKEDFDLQSPEFIRFCTSYAAERFHDGAMSQERLSYVLNRECASHLFEFRTENKVIGYVLAAISDNSLQYWYAFFDTDYMKSHSLGKWLMWRVIRWAKDNKLDYVYLGTSYGQHALYKIRDHKGLAYFDGNKWNSDLKQLKQLCKTDNGERSADLFKNLEDQGAYLENI
jgi:arginine-tRNA-protein transferase